MGSPLGPAGDELPSLQIPMKLEEGTKYLILKTLEKYNGNKTRAAEVLGIDPSTLYRKLNRYGLTES